ncbi:MAG: 6,7-dimethyl-8-ribityllumazine synthase [Chthoniobacterales bacterium]
MSTKLPARPAKLHAPTAPRFAIVASEYNPEFVQSLVNHACKEIYQIDEDSLIELFNAPGSFEIPLVAEMVAVQKRHDVIITLGLVLPGRTKHAEFIMQSVSQALQQVALRHLIPVIHEVLLVADEGEARERCLERKLNRGVEAARAAFTMLRVREDLRKKVSAR